MFERFRRKLPHAVLLSFDILRRIHCDKGELFDDLVVFSQDA
jgi:hypothetical protein